MKVKQSCDTAEDEKMSGQTMLLDPRIIAHHCQSVFYFVCKICVKGFHLANNYSYTSRHDYRVESNWRRDRE